MDDGVFNFYLLSKRNPDLDNLFHEYAQLEKIIAVQGIVSNCEEVSFTKSYPHKWSNPLPLHGHHHLMKTGHLAFVKGQLAHDNWGADTTHHWRLSSSDSRCIRFRHNSHRHRRC